MPHGVTFDLTPTKHGGTGKMSIHDVDFPFQFDGEKAFYNISKPTQDDVDTLDCFELTSIIPPTINHIRRKHKQTTPTDIPIDEWRKRMAWTTEDRIKATLRNTTQMYLSVDSDVRENMRRHYKSRFPGLRHPRQHEMVATDTFFPSVKSRRGNTCSQIFVGIQSNRWEVYPLKTESNNGEALQDYTRQIGVPSVLKSDNAQSETGETWTKHCRDQCIATETTEPHTPWQNPAEQAIGTLGRMVRRVLRNTGAPLVEHDWCQLYCVQIHNHLACRRNNNATPLQLSEGSTPDVSKFRFYFWEPIWYHDPSTKQPEDNLKKGRYLCIAENSGDEMTYHIRTEKDEGTNVYLVRSLIKSRRKHIGTDTEYTNNDAELADKFTLDPTKDLISHDDDIDTINNNEEDDPDTPDTNENILDHLTDETAEIITDQFDGEENEDPNYQFDCIVDHYFKDGILYLKVKYYDDNLVEDTVLEIPFSILKKDVPVELAKYIRSKVLEHKRNGHYNTWAKTTLKAHNRTVRRLHRYYNTGSTIRCYQNRLRRKLSTNKRIAMKGTREKFGIKIPNSTREALLFDKLNNDTKWGDAIAKEMNGLCRLNVFKFFSPSHKLDKQNGWQYAPLHMIFDIKREDRRYKARLVIGGNVIDSSDYTTYSSTVQDISTRLLQLVAVQNGLGIMTGDIANAFCTAPCAEKIWSVAGPEFGERKGSIVVLNRALYGLKTASRSFHEFFGDCLRRMGFLPTRADPDLWYKQSTDYKGYDYIATHVDDFIIAAKRPLEYMSQIEQEFLIRNKEDSPNYYLGNSYTRRGKDDRYLHVSSKKYVAEVLDKYQTKYGSIKKESIPMSPNAHPELDNSPFLNEEGIRHFQHIIGVSQWLIITGRFDIQYATCSLSRFSISPREGHLSLARGIFGYLRKYPKKGYLINPDPPRIDIEYEDVKVKTDYGYQYDYFKEDIDPRFPTPLISELDINVFCDADHAHDKLTGRSITAILGFVGSTPTIWHSKRQTSVQTSSFGAEFTALKKAVEEVVALRYHLRSMGVLITKPSPIYVDNMSVVLNASNPGSSLNKKTVALCYHFVREHVANDVCRIRKIATDQNYADPLSKALNSTLHHGFFHEVLTN